MGEGIKLGGGAGGVMNAVIDEYLSVEGEISANSFVEFVSESTVGTLSALIGASSNARMNACVLSENKVFVITTTESDNNIRGAVVTITDNSLSAGSAVVVGTTPNYNYSRLFGCTAIDESKVLIAYNNESDYRCARVLTINGNSISAGTILTFNVANDSPNKFIAITMPNNYVYLIIGDTSKGVQGILLKVSGTTITIAKGTHTVGPTSSGSSPPVVAARLDDERIFVYYTYWNGSNSGSTNYRQRGVVVTVSNGSATVGAVTQLNNYYYYLSNIGVCKVSENKVLCTFNNTDNAKAIKGFVVDVVGSEITAHEQYTLISTSSADGSGTINCLAQLRDGMCALISSTQSKVFFINVVGTQVEIFSNSGSVTLASNYYNLLALNSGKLFIVGRNNSNAAGQIVKYTSGIRLSTTQINGMTRTRVTTTKPGKVWVLP